MSKQISNIQTGGDILIECLLKEGVKYMFGIPGGQLLTMYDALHRWGNAEGIKTVMVRHEQAGGHAADAYARVTGKIGVCFGTVGPGVLNIVPGVGAAWSDNTPLLVLGAQVREEMEGKSCLQADIDQLQMMAPITVAQFQICDPMDIPKIIPEAIKAAFTPRRGPVYVEIRENALTAPITEDMKYELLSPKDYYPDVDIAGANAKLEEAVEVLKDAQKPLIVVGGQAVSYDATEEINKLSEKYMIPVGTSFTGVGGASNELPTYLGASNNADSLTNAAMYADVIISIGCKWDYSLAFGAAPLWSDKQKLIQIDINPDEFGKNREVTVAIEGNCKTVTKQLLQVMEDKLPKEKIEEWSQWNTEQQEYKKKQLKRYEKKNNSDKVPILPQRLIKDLLEEIPSDAILIADGGDISVFATEQIDLYKFRPPRSNLASVGMGHLGIGIPFAIGAKLAFPDRLVGVLNGDGSFMFNVQELETAVRYNLPILIVIANNDSWGMIKSGQQLSMKKRFIDVELPSGINHAKIAEAFGCYGELITEPGEIKPAIKRAIASGKPAVLDVKIAFDIPKGTKLMLQLGLL